ncbi:MAG: DedA family protein [Alphaproteobacteria bacterium]|nr:DedA family protein [Alphaproteobacteria bacterium]
MLGASSDPLMAPRAPAFGSTIRDPTWGSGEDDAGAMLQELISEYGYWAVFVGTFFEGETILVLGGVAAKLGYLDYWTVVLAAFVGSTLGDQLWYFLGYRYGHWVLVRLPGWRAPMDRAFRLLNKYDTWFILSFRFIYGIRTVSSVVIGMAKVPPRRFIPLNIVAAAIWASVVAYLGYAFGHAIELFLEEFHQYANYVLGGLIGIAILVWIVHTIRRSRQSRAVVVEENPGGPPAFHHIDAAATERKPDSAPEAAAPARREPAGSQVSTGVSARAPHSAQEPS